MIPCVFEDVARVCGHQRDRLRHVQRGAATQSDYCVGVVRLVRGGARHHLPAHRIARDVGEDRGVKTGQPTQEVPQQRQRGDTAIGDDERPCHALAFQVVGDQPARAGSEVDGRGKGEALDHGGLLS